MPKIRYQTQKFRTATLQMIAQANIIIEEYAQQGFDLTLRQLYYQFVARGLIPNNQQEYKKLGSTVNDARLAGMIDWDHITDRTRNLHSLSNWNSPDSIIAACSHQFRFDKWKDQEYRPEVWIEKEALSGVFEQVCDELDIPMFACRGYTSQSEMWSAGQRLHRHKRNAQTPIIFHFGDHDPSGIDMTRDIQDRLKLFMGGLEVERLALNMPQVDEFSPPPNPAKISDTRADAYMALYGDESWELDALDPNTLTNLVRDSVANIRDDTKWNKAVEREQEARRLIGEVAQNWKEITKNL